MKSEPSFGDIVAASFVGALAGVALLAVTWVGIPAILSGDVLAALASVGVFFGLGVFLAMFLAWPLGCVFGAAVSKLAGHGYWQAGVAGAATGAALIILPRAMFAGPSSLLPLPLDGLALSGLLGAVSGLAGWHAVARAARRNQQ